MKSHRIAMRAHVELHLRNAIVRCHVHVDVEQSDKQRANDKHNREPCWYCRWRLAEC